MFALLSALEKDVRDISDRAGRTLALLATPESLPAPLLYQEAMHGISEICGMWEDHRVRMSNAMHLIVAQDPYFVGFLEKLGRDAAAVGQQLHALSSAGWPRKPEIGVNSIRVRGKEILTATLLQLESERTTVVPLLRRRTSLRATSRMGELASA